VKSKTVFMGTTAIAPAKTIAEITGVLVESGARQINTEYDARGHCTGIRFMVQAGGRDMVFLLPARIDPLLKHVRNNREQAARTAWRPILRWCQAQLAMIEVGMVKAEEVYAPYWMQPNGQTLFEAIQSAGPLQLTAGEVKRA
jgi:hypothetical protein